MDWRGRKVLITGASSGFGEATAREMALNGAQVIAVARREPMLRKLVEELSGDGHSYEVCDVSDLASVRQLSERVAARNEHLDVLVNNAGVSTGGRLSAATSEEFERVIRTNLLGPAWCTRELLDLLKAAPSGPRTPCVVNVASMAGRIALPFSADYSASKFGLVGMSESAAYDLADLGVRVMMVNPGFADTEGFPMTALRKNPLTRWMVMDAERVARALIGGIERGSSEVRVQWWLHIVYALSVASGPLRRWAVSSIRKRFPTEL